MSIGFRAFLEIERPDSSLLEAYREIPSSNIGDCVKRMNCMFGGIRSYNSLKVVGPAFTVKVPAGDNLVAGFISGILRGESFRACCERGLRRAALSIGHLGAN